jgi:hypothetical protein
MFGAFQNSGDQQGPLGNIQNEVASVLNANGDRPNVYIPGGPGEPVFQAPNPRYVLRDLFSGIFRLFRR